MKSKKLLARLAGFLGADAQTQRAESAEIKRVLKALKGKERKIRQQLENCSDDGERAALQTRLDVIYAQRQKGVERVQKIRGDEAKSDHSESDHKAK